MTSTILDTTQLCRAVSLKSDLQQVPVEDGVGVQAPGDVLQWIDEDPQPGLREWKWLYAVEQASLSHHDPEEIVREAFESVNKIAIDKIADKERGGPGFYWRVSMGVSGGTIVITQSDLTKLQKGFQRLAVYVLVNNKYKFVDGSTFNTEKELRAAKLPRSIAKHFKVEKGGFYVFDNKIMPLTGKPRGSIDDQFFLPLWEAKDDGERAFFLARTGVESLADQEEVLKSLADQEEDDMVEEASGFDLLLRTEPLRGLVEDWLRRGDHETVEREAQRKIIQRQEAEEK